MPFVSVVVSVSGAFEGGPTGGGMSYPTSSSVMGTDSLGVPKNIESNPEGFSTTAGAACDGDEVLKLRTWPKRMGAALRRALPDSMAAILSRFSALRELTKAQAPQTLLQPTFSALWLTSLLML